MTSSKVNGLSKSSYGFAEEDLKHPVRKIVLEKVYLCGH